MKLRIIAIGDELLIGQTTDTNSGYLARTLDRFGWELDRVTIIPDNHDEIIETIKQEFIDCDVIITSGGLGPTRDDITKKALLEVFGGELRRDDNVTLNIKKIFERRNRKLNELTLDQALVPTSCEVIQNDHGTAPIMLFRKGSKTLVSLPGVPSEFEHGWSEKVFPVLRELYPSDYAIERRSFIVKGITESALAQLLASFEDSLPSYLHLAYLPQKSYIRLRIDGRYGDSEHLEKILEQKTEQLKHTIGSYLLAEGDLSPVEILFHLLGKQKLTVATAESCTGGSISSSITAVAGSSSYFKGGVVAYSNEVKQTVLGVGTSTLQTYGAVSEQTVTEMLSGIRRITGSDCAIATSGIAGPGGGSKEKPVGTVCIGIATPQRTCVETVHFSGSRGFIVTQTVVTALVRLIDMLK